MSRLVPSLLLLAVVGGVAVGAAPTLRTSAETEQAYVDRLLEMQDSPQDHAALAKWCAANGLPQRALVHWQEVLVRAPDSFAARSALGFVKRGDSWVRAGVLSAGASESSVGSGSGVALPGLSEAGRQQSAFEEVRQVARTLLFPDQPEKWREGVLRILVLRHETAAGPVARVLGSGGVEHRRLACQALAGIPGDESTSYLLGFLLADESRAVHEAALESLQDRIDPRVVDQLIFALARGRRTTMQRAAHALGVLGVAEAVPALIANLQIAQYRTVQERQVRYPPPIRGGIAFVAGMRPVVGPHTVAYDPIIGYITPEGIRIPRYEYPVEVLVEKTERHMVDVPEVREALKAITDQDFGYDPAAWRRWYLMTTRSSNSPSP